MSLLIGITTSILSSVAMEGFGGGDTEAVNQIFDLTSTLPTELTYTRNDSVATYRNSLGRWVAGTANTPRFHLNSSTSPIGILIESGRTNKCTAYNASPTNLTNVTAGGNVSAVVSVVSDTAKLQADGIYVGNGNVIEVDNTQGGSGTAYVHISGTFANTNVHSYSTFAYVVAGTNGYISDSGGDGVTVCPSTGGYTRTVKENFTPSNSGRTIRLAAPFGCKVRFILFQLEEGAFATTPIIVGGASAARASDRLRDSAFNTREWFNAEQGAIVVEGMFFQDRYLTNPGYLFSAGTEFMNLLAVYSAGARSKFQTRGYTLQTPARAVTASTGVDIDNDVITTNVAHGFTTGDRVGGAPATSSTMPAGTATGTTYYARVLSTTTFQLHTSQAGANANTGKVNITSVGTGTINFYKTADHFTTDIPSGQVKNQPTFGGITWEENTSLISFGDGFAHRTVTSGVGTLGADLFANFDIGSRNSQQINGVITKVVVSNRKKTLPQMGSMLSARTRRAIIGSGQSNMEIFFGNQDDLTHAPSSILGDNDGQRALVTEMNNYWTGSDNFAINGATSGSRAIKGVSDVAGWWYDPANDVFGDCYENFITNAQAFIAAGGTIEAIVWDQGESDTGATYQNYYDALEIIFNKMWNDLGDIPIIITCIGRREDSGSSNLGYNNVGTVQRDLAEAYELIHIGPEKVIQALGDGLVHMSGAGAAAHAPLLIRKIMSVLGEDVTDGVDGPSIIGAKRVGTEVTVTLLHDDGATDFTPTSDIAGFHFYDNTSEITINSAIRKNATEITLTLATEPSSGTEILWYIYGTAYADRLVYTNFLKDNSTHTMPLKRARVVLPLEPPPTFILLENGSYLLTQSGDKFVLD